MIDDNINNKKSSELDKKTERIDKLINKTNSGKSAFFAGKLLFEIKDKKEFINKGYNSFSLYLKNELRTSDVKANSYINIYLIYNEDDIGDLILVTHLSYLAEQDEDIREKILLVAKEIDKKTTNANQQKVEKGSNKIENPKKVEISLKNNLPSNETSKNENKTFKIRPEYDKDVLTTSINLLNSAKNDGQKITEELAQTAFDISTKINQERDFEKIKLPNSVGKRLEPKYFLELSDLYKYEPINEYNLVALFCIMFHLIKTTEFKYNKNTILRFNSINFVRAEFPDAEIEFFDINKQRYSNLLIEFEFRSSNYIIHEHPKSQINCNLIICWENNLNKKDIEKFGMKIPPIISISELLKTGKIELC